MTFVLPDRRRLDVAVPEGATLLEAARLHGIEIEGACGGSMACATCHMHVPDDWFDRLPPPTGEEEDILDFAVELCPTSRLGCQVRMTAALDGMVVQVPRTTLLRG